MRLSLAIVALLLSAPLARAADKAQAEAALAAAHQQEEQAGKFGNRWLPAEAALKSAAKAVAAGDWDKAVAEADRARAMATRAIEQAHEQEIAWHEMVIK